MPNAEVKIGENNEILVRGGMVMKGYYKKPEETAQAFTEDGFLKREMPVSLMLKVIYLLPIVLKN